MRGERSPQVNDWTLISVVSQAKWAKACSVPSCVWAATTNTRLLSVPHSRRSHLTVTQPWRSSSWPRPSGCCWRTRAATKSGTSWGGRSAATQHRWYWSGWPETRWVPCHTRADTQTSHQTQLLTIWCWCIKLCCTTSMSPENIKNEGRQKFHQLEEYEHQLTFRSHIWSVCWEFLHLHFKTKTQQKNVLFLNSNLTTAALQVEEVKVEDCWVNNGVARLPSPWLLLVVDVGLWSWSLTSGGL